MSEAAPFDLEAEMARRRQMREGDEFAARMRARTVAWEQRLDREWSPWAIVTVSAVSTAALILGSAAFFVFLAKACR